MKKITVSGKKRIILSTDTIRSQERLASTIKLNSKKIIADDNLPLSDEMSLWLSEKVCDIDEKGFLNESVASVLVSPLDAMSVFCPTGSIIHSRQFAARSQMETQKTATAKSFRSFDSSSKSSTGIADENITSLDEVINRMDIVWLKRRAGFELEDGDLNKSVQTLNEAIKIHIGSNNYEDANLREAVNFSDPNEILHVIKENYFVSDSNSYMIAGRIQRWYLKRYRKKCVAASLLSRFYRGFRVRRQMWKRLQLRLQCAINIQRRFRKHLIRMNRLCTKIKQWYNICKFRSEYRSRLRIYQLVRRIQRLFRGIQGRKLVNFRIKQIHSACIIQRNIRGYFLRHTRGFALSMYFRLFYRSARTIQCMARRASSVSRARKLLMEIIVLEDTRLAQENSVYDEAVRVEARRAKLCLHTTAGWLHRQDASLAIKQKDAKYALLKSTLSRGDLIDHELNRYFELFDKSGNGMMTVNDLFKLLSELAISTSAEERKRLQDDFIVNPQGKISFQQFVEWYKSGGHMALRGGYFGTYSRFLLVARQKVREALHINLWKRTRQEVLRQRCGHIHGNVIARFRAHNPPKYQCCRCLQPFVLFTDYFAHFTKNKACSVTGERALFYSHFWIHSEWVRQRECEKEMIRVQNEKPWVQHRSLLAGYADLAIQRKKEMSAWLSDLQKRASRMYYAMLCVEEGSIIFSRRILEIVNFTDNPKTLNPSVVKCLFRCLGRRIPQHWIQDNIWDVEELRCWLEATVDLPGALHVVTGRVWASASRNMLRWRDANALGRIHVRCLRVAQIQIEASVVALDEYRRALPRMLKVSDDELRRLRLLKLTSEAYDKEKLTLDSSMAAVDRLYLRLLSAEWDQKPTALARISTLALSRFSPIGPKMESYSNPATIKHFITKDANIRAIARVKERSWGRIGRTQLFRESYELWAMKHLFILKLSAELATEKAEAEASMRYLFEIYRPVSTLPGVNIEDFGLLQSALGICVNGDLEWQAVMEVLDPDNSGFICLENFLTWTLSGQYLKYSNGMMKAYNLLCNSLFQVSGLAFLIDARTRVLVNLRCLHRLELASCHANMDDLSAANLPLSAHCTADISQALKVREELQEVLFSAFETLKREDERGELLLLRRIAANDAARLCMLRFLTYSGQKQIQMESLLVHASKEMLAAVGSCLPLSSAHSSISIVLLPVVLSFDTDCSGAFDLDELALLLRAILRHVSEKRILLQFPELKVGTVPIPKVSQYISDVCQRKKPLLGSRGSCDFKIWTQPNRSIAASLLISLSKQSASILSSSAAALSTPGAAVAATDAEQSVASRIVRSQMLAMRQVRIVSRHPFGKIQELFEGHSLLRAISAQYSRDEIIRHAYRVHREKKGLLVTEVPHVVRYLQRVWRLLPSARMSLVLELVATVSSRKSLRWLSEEDLLTLLDSGTLTMGTRVKNTKKQQRFDGHYRMLSVARQQAVLITLGSRNLNAAETNYRCLLIGLDIVVREHAKNANWNILRINKDNSWVSWDNVPAQALPILALSIGFSYKDVVEDPALLDLLGAVQAHRHGAFDLELRDVFGTVKCLKDASKRKGLIYDLFRESKGLAARHVWSVYYERVVKALALYHREIDKKALPFLNELLTGVSHKNIFT